jgi:gentisate 1,2-dioxygenase
VPRASWRRRSAIAAPALIICRGSGATTIDGKTLHWQQDDQFFVPLRSWHGHATLAAAEEAILFSRHDAPLLKAVGIELEERET